MSRSKLGFLAHVLETAGSGATRERIASESNASHKLVGRSLGLLENLNLLIEKHNSQTSFVTTDRGHQFLHDYEKLTKQLGIDDYPTWRRALCKYRLAFK